MLLLQQCYFYFEEVQYHDLFVVLMLLDVTADRTHFKGLDLNYISKNTKWLFNASCHHVGLFCELTGQQTERLMPKPTKAKTEKVFYIWATVVFLSL